MTIREIAYRSELWEEFLQLRRVVLRWPLGLEYSEADIEAEAEDVCLVALVDQKIVGGLLLRPHGTDLKMRQVAVDPERQGQGIGKSLVIASEVLALERMFERIVLHARVTAVPFYLSCGYCIEGEEFSEVGIPHRFMLKNLK